MRNIEKFFDDHPELSGRKQQILKNALGHADGKAISGGSVALFMEDLNSQFWNDWEEDPEHVKIAMEDVGHLAKN